MKLLRLTLVLASASCLSLGSAWATPITVNNPSFETLPGGGLGSGCGTDCVYGVNAIPGWSNSGTSGQFQPGPPANTAYFDYVPDGVTVAYTNGPDITQTVGTTVKNGTTYTLTVALGSRNDTGFGSAAGLLIDGVLYPAVGTVPTPGTWSTFTTTYIGTAADAGKSITIDLIDTGAQGDFDSVALSDNADVVPEPSSIALLGTGMLGLAGLARRKFRS